MDTLRTSAAADFDAPYGLLIDGKIIESNSTFDVFNPASNEVLAQAPDASPEQLNDAVAAAKRAFPAWAALSWEEREAFIVKLYEALEAQKEEFITLLSLEQGKPRHSQADFEVNLANPWIPKTAKSRLGVEVIEDTDVHRVEVRRAPLGVVGAIIPWNYPYLHVLWKSVPALITGNTVVLKPSPYTPLCALKIGEIVAKVLPAGVFNIVTGGNDLGRLLTEHPDVGMITFTGSTATGKRIMASGAGTVKRITLELGGNDPAILLPDADWKSVVPSVFWSAFGNSGQWCIAAKRIYTHKSFHDDFVKAFADYASQQKVGDGMDPTSVLGPVNNRMQFNKLVEMFEDVKANGYKIALGGDIDPNSKGNFVPVTVVDNPPEDSRIVTEEPFGPIVPIIAYDNVEEVIAKANGTPFGLGATIWGRDRAQAEAVADRIDAGNVWVNEGQNHPINAPFGGHKQSGLSVEHGGEGLASHTNSKTVMIHK
ncbi:MAG: aldehyde dehydrogenase family protein [Mesorhizobium sp.]|uniref:aldehyde dehydrogenase family protein n=1 Tax=Mesorhizobium sp. TaxID=1871066 RepID=UPI001ACE90C1|nr:aldehyde dehydrogenase family protein [Mesorhizobium sp.]MBN9217267.1 aldehyde dehydrogenase family protein [Mesorhizobium sp.]